MLSLDRRKFLTVAGGVSLALVLPSFAFAEGGTLDDIRKRGKLTVGTEAAYEPFEFVENGQVVGYGHDILEYMAGKLGVSLNQVNLPFQGLLPGLMAHKFDFVATSVGINAERARRFAFSEPVGVVDTVLVVRSNDTHINKADDVAGHVVGTQMGSSSQPVAQAFDTQLKAKGAGYADMKLFQAYPDVMVALSNKTLDVGIMPSNIVAVMMKREPGQYRVIGKIGEPKMLAWVAHPQDKEVRAFINTSLNQLEQNGQLAQMQKKWFGYTMNLPTSGYLPEGAV
ncbi:transporter substrate-binding domain-containing protein [Paraburkholderia edwinii]|jgi:polar amino acid transport system substrate-binding protein|uniref:Transporter substrate-binding domain-containing protein n=1 Tax=Paraburkholderia edwinii TaxID=2861782 RepID=A0ABX8V304_9BURK|nr:transporter substrate-binding domain-containing protein [Paraburkholderia edwinii]QYD73448.1 transporter substrate-binding domain-containing protein [Paraburkholderia edwinii]